MKHPAHQHLGKPAPLPTLRSQDSDAAWVAGWWQGTVTGFMLGLGAAVLLGWLR